MEKEALRNYENPFSVDGEGEATTEGRENLRRIHTEADTKRRRTRPFAILGSVKTKGSKSFACAVNAFIAASLWYLFYTTFVASG